MMAGGVTHIINKEINYFVLGFGPSAGKPKHLLPLNSVPLHGNLKKLPSASVH